MESAFGFVTVLPGAFSAYRFEALKGAPLAAYFHGEDMKKNTEKPAGVLESNMYLAEDRILCFELVAKRNAKYMLRYVHDSFGVTDVPSTVNEFINQRRRWLNGSFFAALYSVMHFYRFGGSNHSFGRKILLFIEVFYQTVNILLSWVSLASYFLVFRILTIGVTATSVGFTAGNILAVIFLWIYLVALGLTFILSFGNKPNDARKLYILAFVLFSVVMVYMMFCVIIMTVSSVKSLENEMKAGTLTALGLFKNSTFRGMTVSLASTYAIYILGSLLFFDCFHLFACTLQYLLLSPAYINVLTIFAFCNMHDISWGTKGALKVEGGAKKQANTADGKNLVLSDALQDPDEMYLLAQKNIEKLDIPERISTQNQSVKNYAKGRTYTVMLWLISNFILLVIVMNTGGMNEFDEIEEDKGTSTTTSDTSAFSSKMKRALFSFAKRSDDSTEKKVSQRSSIFMNVILWLVAALALFRFGGAIIYRIGMPIRRRRFHKQYMP
ncbi:unnamed protein product [Ambrosiozyma monospora]|uniref:Chitin synthase n=1 Tax=Ambrosiozyma monospora TaxID=43982 RepID=A0A9W7DDH2_AMBMO|nr:unnamed protein product [Ambrosiozyma monospora]